MEITETTIYLSRNLIYGLDLRQHLSLRRIYLSRNLIYGLDGLHFGTTHLIYLSRNLIYGLDLFSASVFCNLP